MTGTFDVHDLTPPAVLKAESLLPSSLILVEFNEPVSKQSAENPANYHFEPPISVVSAALSGDGRKVKLTLAQPLSPQSALTVSDVCDLSPQANRILPKAEPVKIMKQAWQLDSFVGDGKTTKQLEVAALPVNESDGWSINCFVRTDEQPENRTLIAGFGNPVFQEGRGRYLAKFANEIHFWSSRRDGETGTSLDVGKWQMLSLTYDGKLLGIFKNGKKIGESELKFTEDDSMVFIAPLDPWDQKRRFKGEIRNFSIWSTPIPAEGLLELVKQMPE